MGNYNSQIQWGITGNYKKSKNHRIQREIMNLQDVIQHNGKSREITRKAKITGFNGKSNPHTGIKQHSFRDGTIRPSPARAIVPSLNKTSRLGLNIDLPWQRHGSYTSLCKCHPMFAPP